MESDKQQDAVVILKLYELRRDKKMRRARKWFLSEFAPANAMDIAGMFSDGERASWKFRIVTSYWETAAALVLNGGIDRKMFLEANTEHAVVYAKIADLLPELREIFREPDYLLSLETLVRSMPDFDTKIASRKRLLELWTKATKEKKSEGVGEVKDPAHTRNL